MIVDNKAKNTFENAYEVKKWLDDKNKIRNIILVSSYYHLPRSYIVFKKIIKTKEIVLSPVNKKISLNENYGFYIRLIILEFLKPFTPYFLKNEFFKKFYFLPFFYTWTTCYFVLFSPVRFFNIKLVIYLSSFWTRTVIKLSYVILGIDYKITGLKNIPTKGKFIVASNHQSAWETFLIGTLFPGSVFILKNELRKILSSQCIFKKIGFYFFVKRNQVIKSLKLVVKSVRELSKKKKMFL